MFVELIEIPYSEYERLRRIEQSFMRAELDRRLKDRTPVPLEAKRLPAKVVGLFEAKEKR